eukprot:4326332-Amphidinium_carterae.1
MISHVSGAHTFATLICARFGFLEEDTYQKPSNAMLVTVQLVVVGRLANRRGTVRLRCSITAAQ